ncbi:hypothetical protein [Terrisporobacter mayombei]|uniref:Uncharacterized protein n=1 Tax=Terrisporobacter mayombei TaxID=1541 RepID=A0ABY9PX05_9FIRM|nr:hypothetical protein [Terrisporobacter mayombei]MCC3870265.1 hypothetical protein [Terrisporobacter mayombei]WMT79891.1 hypothetical protein TEMA_01620 [Terrisporobacter mayombei]
MNKSDLKDGMIVELKKGTRFMLVNDCLYNEKNDYNLSHYNDKLICTHITKILDIVKVYTIDISKFVKNEFDSIKLKDMLEDKYLKLIWKREEIDWSKVPIGTKVLVSDTKINWFNGIFLRKIEHSKNDNCFRIVNLSGDVERWKYCKLAEETKEKVTFSDIDKEMNKYCDEHNESEICSKRCDSCGMKYILDNYNVTRK